MKLYLSSYHLGDHPDQLVGLLSQNRKGVVIANARDDWKEEKRQESVQRDISELSALHLDVEELDLRKYFGKGNDLKTILNNCGFIFVTGGNVFILRRAMNQSGFDEFLKEKKSDEDFVYAGYSAGVCVLAPTLHGLELVDKNNSIPLSYQEEIIWDGLGIISYSFAPHYRSPHPESPLIEKEIQYLKENNIPFKALHDGEVIIESTN